MKKPDAPYWPLFTVTALATITIVVMAVSGENDQARLTDLQRSYTQLTDTPTPTITKTVTTPGPTVTVKTPGPTRTIIVSRSKVRTPSRLTTTHTKAPRPAANTGRPSGSWLALAKCESGANLRYDDGTYVGAYNFSRSTWNGYTKGRFGPATSATWAEQTFVAYRIWRNAGWSAFPGCGRKMGHPSMPPVPAP